MLTATLVLLAAIFLVPTAAQAKVAVGMADQNATMFDNESYKRLGIKKIRYLVAWDWYKRDWETAEVDAFMKRAETAGADVLVHFTASRGCFDNARYSRSKACKAPSVAKYRSAYKRFRKLYPFVKTYGVWNEGNHPSQPTSRKPKLAAQYFLALRKDCRGCKIVAADVLDQKNMIPWLKTFKRYAKGKAKIWGLHNYGDVNRRRTTYTDRMLRNAPGEVWLTETGGIMQFGDAFPRSAARQSSRTRYMFSLVKRFSKKRSGRVGRVTRLYNYQWTGAEPSARFDAGLVNPDGTERKAYTTFSKLAKSFRR